MSPTERLLVRAGYAVKKAECTDADVDAITTELIVTPGLPETSPVPPRPFAIYCETPTRYIVPKYWGIRRWGPPTQVKLPEGALMQPGLQFTGTLRPTQQGIVNAFVTGGSDGLICVPCGIGKTFMALYIAHRQGRVTAVVVHKKFLMDQWRDEIERFIPGARIGRLYADIVDIEDKDIILIMVQSLMTNKYPAEYFADIGFTIWDECHHLGAEQFSRTMRYLRARNALGLTATPQRADGLQRVFELGLGPIRFQCKRRDLFADDRIRVAMIEYHPGHVGTEDYFDIPLDFRKKPKRPLVLNNIAEFTPRTEFIARWGIALANEESGGQVLFLSDRRNQLVALMGLCTAAGVTAGYYYGGMSEAALAESARCRIVLGTWPMASEGMNIPGLTAVVFATPRPEVEQGVGRILRRRMSDRTCTHVCLDFVDVDHPCFSGQINKRKRFYKANHYEIERVVMSDVIDAGRLLRPLEGAGTIGVIVTNVAADDMAPDTGEWENANNAVE